MINKMLEGIFYGAFCVGLLGICLFFYPFRLIIDWEIKKYGRIAKQNLFRQYINN